MTKQTLGYVKLEWVCPNCGSKNPGPQKTCTSCRSPQPEHVQFQQAEQAELITDAGEIAQAKAGADLHCYYCGTRNPATAKTCSQCGADLTQAAARQSGQVLGAYKTGPAEKINCPACGVPNEPKAATCASCGASLVQPKPVQPQPAPVPTKTSFGPVAIIGGVMLLLLVGACIFFFILSTRTNDITGQVQALEWSRTIPIEALVPVTGRAWRDQMPIGAFVNGCTQEQRGTERQSTGQTRQVCGTPYTVDTGTGLGEVKQDCEDEPIYEEMPVYDSLCQYTVTVWQQVDQVILTGTDLNPRWPKPNLRAGQRPGSPNESYQIIFATAEKNYIYTTTNAAEFAQFQPGSRWLLKVNSFDTVTAVEPLRGQ
jgi:ribosomal protein L40E